jgi:hypothetical protein
MSGWLRVLPLLLFVGAVSAGEILPVKGMPIKGDIVSVSDKEVVFIQAGKQQTRSIKDVLKIDFRESGRLPRDTRYAQIELTDGSLLHAESYKIRKRELEAKLLNGLSLRLPLTLVANILNNAEIEANRRDWKSRVFNARGKEAVVVRRGEVISTLECTLGEGDEATGETIGLAVDLGGEVQKATRKLASLQGLLFKHVLDAQATPVLCKLLDTTENVVMVSGIAPREGGGLTVTTPAGAQLSFRNEQIVRLDYTKGKLEYLSDLEPTRVLARSNLDEEGEPNQWHVYRDSNLNKGALTLGGVTYSKGLALKPYVELTYDLKGEYREFEAIVGIDDNVSAAGAAILIVEADGRELTRVTIASDAKKRYQPVVLNIKDVQKLRLIVKADGDFDTARHLELADAKVRKE